MDFSCLFIFVSVNPKDGDALFCMVFIFATNNKFKKKNLAH